MIEVSDNSIRIALLQGYDKGSKEVNLAYTIGRIREAALGGAKIICTQELFNLPYFCTIQDSENFNLAETVPGPTTDKLAMLAKKLEVVLIASLFERRSSGIYHNTAAILDADGSYLGKYRKMHIPQDPGFEEKFYFTPGDLGYKVWDTEFGKIGVLICWDQWFPEAARLAALGGAKIIFYPSAIGCLKNEKCDLGIAQHNAWETIQCGHAVANGCYVATVNRVGQESEIEFWGQSFIADSYGQVMDRASADSDAIVYADCDLLGLEETRRDWPFFRDRRVASYSGISELMLDQEKG
ncbi:MAG: carbon-nitrogen hydrolase [Verrucomicrobiota bacterium]|nr:carbon-nitrogen hydrolase [Verrucomicrobiota bacterium]